MRVILFLVLVLACAIIAAAPKEWINKKAKYSTITIIILSIVVGYFYGLKDDSDSAKRAQIEASFRAGEVIKCGEYEVKNELWEYEFGTQSFIAKRSAKNLGGVIIPIKSCMK